MCWEDAKHRAAHPFSLLWQPSALVVTSRMFSQQMQLRLLCERILQTFSYMLWFQSHWHPDRLPPTPQNRSGINRSPEQPVRCSPAVRGHHVAGIADRVCMLPQSVPP